MKSLPLPTHTYFFHFDRRTDYSPGIGIQGASRRNSINWMEVHSFAIKCILIFIADSHRFQFDGTLIKCALCGAAFARRVRPYLVFSGRRGAGAGTTYYWLLPCTFQPALLPLTYKVTIETRALISS